VYVYEKSINSRRK